MEIISIILLYNISMLIKNVIKWLFCISITLFIIDILYIAFVGAKISANIDLQILAYTVISIFTIILTWTLSFIKIKPKYKLLMGLLLVLWILSTNYLPSVKTQINNDFCIDTENDVLYSINGNRRSTENVVNFCNFLRQSDKNITQNSILSFYTSIYGVSPNEVTVENGSVTLTFDSQNVNMEVGVKIDG